MKISIVTASYRQLDWLRLCVASVADQEGVDVEHIIQDAGSEGIEDLARELAVPLFREGQPVWAPHAPAGPPSARRLVIHVERDRGMYDAINRGLLKASGEILAYLNSDEQYLPGALAAVLGRFEQQPATEVLFAYAIHTRNSPPGRREFQVTAPTFRWRR